MKYSYESEDLIDEVKEDILEFGEDEKVYVWKKFFLNMTTFNSL